MNWLRSQWLALRQAALRMLRMPFNTVLAALVVAIAAALPGAGWMLVDNLQRLSSGLSATPELSVFMLTGASAEQVKAAGVRIREAAPADAKLKFVSRESVAERFRANEGLSDVLDALQDNPFPDAWVLTPGALDATALEALRERLGRIDAVEQVQLDSAWARRLDAFVTLGRQIVLMLASTLGLGFVLVIFNTIRLQLLTRRDEIEVSWLLGASDAWIRRPFHWFGALQGALGGLLACALVTLAAHQLTPAVADLAGLYSLQFALHPLSTMQNLLLVLACALLGWLGAGLSVRRHLARLG